MRDKLFEIRWLLHYRNWKPTRQKFKQFERDMQVYRETGAVPWRA